MRARAYVPLEMVTGELVTSQQTFVRDAGLGVRHTCDLHWRVSNRAAFSRILPWERLAAEARPSPALDTGASVLSPPHALLLACLHRVAHHFDPPTLIWLYDIHLLASSMSEDDAARFVALAVDSGLAAICARGLALSQHHFRTPLPAAFDHLVPAGDEPLAAYMDHGVSALRRARLGPAGARRASRPLAVVARTPVSAVPVPARSPFAPGLGSAAMGVRAPDRVGRLTLVSGGERVIDQERETDVMPLTAGSNHGASRADSDLFVGLTRELLQRGCHVRFRAAGTSMHPTIRDGEVVTVAPASGDAFAVGDVLLCRFGRRPTAHRVVAVQPSDDGRPVLHLRGDNLCSPDGPVRAEDVIGRVLTVSRDGSEQPLDGPGRLVRLRRIARWLFAAAVVWATVMGASEASAQIGTTLTWVGGNGPNWSTRQNWIPAEIPSRGDNLVFPASLFRITNNDLVDLSVESVTIRDNYTISGLALEITGDPGLLVESPAVTVTVALNLTLNRDPIHVATNAGTLELSGRITARNFVKQGAGTLVLSGANDDITDLVGEDGCGVIRATNPLALGVSLVGRIQLGQNCTLQVEANTTLDKPIILNGMGAPGTTGALVITAGVTLTERLELRVDSPAKISVLSGATLDLPDSGVGLTTNLNSPLTVNVAQAGAARISRVIAGIGDLIKEGAGSLFLNKNNTYNGQTTISGGTVIIDGDQPDSPVVLDGGTVAGGGTLGHDQRDRGRRHDQRRAVRAETSWAARSVTMNAATTFEVEFNGNQHDQLFVNGSVALNGAVLSVLGQFPPNQAVTILDNDLNDAVIGTFAGLPENARVTVGGLPDEDLLYGRQRKRCRSDSRVLALLDPKSSPAPTWATAPTTARSPDLASSPIS